MRAVYSGGAVLLAAEGGLPVASCCSLGEPFVGEELSLAAVELLALRAVYSSGAELLGVEGNLQVVCCRSLRGSACFASGVFQRHGVTCCGRQLAGGKLSFAAAGLLVFVGGVFRRRGFGCCGRQHVCSKLLLAVMGQLVVRARYSGGAVLVAVVDSLQAASCLPQQPSSKRFPCADKRRKNPAIPPNGTRSTGSPKSR